MGKEYLDLTMGQIQALVQKLGIDNVNRILGGEGRLGAKVTSLVLETVNFTLMGPGIMPDVNGHLDMPFDRVTFGDGLQDYPMDEMGARDKVTALPALGMLRFSVCNYPMASQRIHDYMEPNTGTRDDSIYVWLRRLALTVQLHECGDKQGLLSRTSPNLFLVRQQHFLSAFLSLVWNAGDKTWRLDLVRTDSSQEFPVGTVVFADPYCSSQE